MKVNGQLENAQLEQIAATSTTPASTGRMYSDITAPAAALPKYYDGSLWRTLAFTQSNTLVSQNSGTACTVDWSTGLYQRVVLTGNALISFSNPQTGQIHTLIVEQAPLLGSANVPNYQYKLNMIDQDCVYHPYQPVGVIPSGKNYRYTWYYTAAIRPAYANVPANTFLPGVLPSTLATGIDISPDSKNIFMGRTSSPFSSVYDLAVNVSTLNQSIYNVSPVTPATLAAQAVGVAYHPNGRVAFVVSGTSPYIQGWYLDRGVHVGTAIANPGVLPTGAGRCIAVHPSGFYVGVGHTTTPFMSVYPFTSGSVYGTKLSNPGTLPVAAVTALDFSPMGDYLAAASQTTPFIQVWPFTGTDSTAGAIGAAVSNPGTLPAGGPAGSLGKGIAWRPQGDYIAMAMATTPYLYIVPFNRASGAFGTALTISALSGAAVCVQWTPCGQYLIVGTGTTPFLYVYDFSTLALVAVTLDGSNPGQQVNDIAVAKNGDYMALALNAGNFIAGYTLPQKAKNYLRLV